MSDLFLGLVNDRALLVVFTRLALKCMAGRVAAVPPRSPKGPEPQCEKANNARSACVERVEHWDAVLMLSKARSHVCGVEAGALGI
jgi:hypothetical protein